MAMLADSTTGQLTPVSGVTDMNTVQTTDSPTPLVLSDYLTGLDGTSVRSACTYDFAADGTVTQNTP